MRRRDPVSCNTYRAPPAQCALCPRPSESALRKVNTPAFHLGDQVRRKSRCFVPLLELSPEILRREIDERSTAPKEGPFRLPGVALGVLSAL